MTDTGPDKETNDELATLRAYFERRRDALIAELRELDRLLGRPQTIPPRRR